MGPARNRYVNPFGITAAQEHGRKVMRAAVGGKVREDTLRKGL
jgi:IS5 family transposase